MQVFLNPAVFHCNYIFTSKKDKNRKNNKQTNLLLNVKCLCDIKRYVRVSSICVLVFDILGFASVSLRFNLELKLALSNL